MKERYFTPENIDEKSRRMLAAICQSRARPEEQFEPERSALIILDLQRYFLEPDSHAFIPSAVPVVSKIKELAEAYRKRNLPVFVTRHLNTKENAGLMERWWRDLVTKESEMSEIVADLDLSGARVIEKAQYDAFFQTGLNDSLRKCGARQLVVTGVMTHLCCETTARSAFINGLLVFMPIDGTATYTEDFHRASLLNLSHGFAVCPLVADLIAAIEEAVDKA